MIAPGAMMIGGTLQEKEDIVKISIAGPITNMAFSVAFLGISLFCPYIAWIWLDVAFLSIHQRFHGCLQLGSIRRLRWL